MEKQNKEYAESLAKGIYKREPSSISEFARDLAEPKRKAFVNGYMKAIEETNVAELLDALKMLVNKVDEIVEEENLELTDDDKIVIEKSKIAINKAQ